MSTAHTNKSHRSSISVAAPRPTTHLMHCSRCLRHPTRDETHTGLRTCASASDRPTTMSRQFRTQSCMRHDTLSTPDRSHGSPTQPPQARARASESFVGILPASIAILSPRMLRQVLVLRAPAAEMEFARSTSCARTTKATTLRNSTTRCSLAVSRIRSRLHVVNCPFRFSKPVEVLSLRASLRHPLLAKGWRRP